jgi:hypothetical protein
MHKKAAIFDSSVKYGGCVYRTIDIIYRCGCVMVRLLSSLLYILWVNIASVDGSRVAAAVVLPPSRLRWTLHRECYISMHLLPTPCSRLRAEHSASNMGLREVYALRAISLLLFSMHLCNTLLAHGLLPCSPVVRASVAGYVNMSMFSLCQGGNSLPV